MRMIGNLFTADDGSKLFEPDTVLGAQFYETFKQSPHKQPELRLMAAVLEDAVSCLSMRVRRASVRQRKQYEEARRWLAAEDEGDWIFSFKNICEALGINPSYLRRGLLRWAAGESFPASAGRRGSARGLRRHKKVRLRTAS